MPRLIINADDLGLTAGVNRAIFEAQETGVVTSATLMANGKQFEDAVAALRQNDAYRSRRLGIGCHVVLIDGEPLSAPDTIASLLQPGTSTFRRKLSDFALATMSGRVSANHVTIEASAQIRRVQAAGIEVSHVDCHKHAHMFPVVLEGMLRAARECGIRAIRNPFEVAGTVPIETIVRRPKYSIRLLETAMLRLLYARQFARMVREFGLATSDGSVGVTLTGALDVYSFAATLRRIPEGTYELVCHPGYNDSELQQAGTRLTTSRDSERGILSSSASRGILRTLGIQPANFWDIGRRGTSESISSATRPML